MDKFIGPVQPLEGMDRFDYEKIIDNALQRNLTPQELTEELCGDKFRFNAGGLMVEGIDEYGYSVHTEEGLVNRPFEGDERAWLPILAQFAFNDFMLKGHVQHLAEQNEKLIYAVKLNEELDALRKETNANRATIDANAEAAANILFGCPPEGFVETGELSTKEVDNMLFGKPQ